MHFINFILLIAIPFLSNGQSSSGTIAETIATKMKDSLNLTNSQKSQIYTATFQVIEEKKQLIKENAYGHIFRIKEQALENKRDSLYQPVLSLPQYQSYLRKKKVLVGQ